MKQKIGKLIGIAMIVIIIITVLTSIYNEYQDVDCCDFKNTSFKKWYCNGTLVISDQDCIE